MDGSFITSGVWDLSVSRKSRADMDKDEANGMRLVNLKHKLNEVHSDYDFEFVAYEASRNLRYGDAVRVAAELVGVIQVWAIGNIVSFKGYSPSQIKHHATGNGNANKNAMMIAAHKQWPDVHRMGPSEWPSDEADARWLADLAAERLREPSSRGVYIHPQDQQQEIPHD